MVIIKKQSKTILMAFFTIVFGNIAVGHAEFGPFATAGQISEDAVIPVSFIEWEFNHQQASFFADSKNAHSIVLTNGKIYAWGANDHNQLGDGSYTSSDIPIDVTPVGYPLEEGEFFKVAYTGNEHSIALTSFNRVYTWGSNTWGQIGYSYDGFYPSDITFQFNLDHVAGEIVTAVSAGMNHNLVLTSLGRIFAWGKNDFYQVTFDEQEFYDTPIEITEEFQFYVWGNATIIDIFSGGNQSWVLTDIGEVYVWGEKYDDYNADIHSSVSPDRIGLYIGESINQIEIWEDEVLFLTSEGRILYENHNDGHNHTYGHPYLEDMTSFFGMYMEGTPIDISFGANYVLILYDSGQVLGWGDNSLGQIRYGGDAEYPWAVDITSDFWLNMGDKVTNVFAGNSFSIAVTDLGAIYAWGGQYPYTEHYYTINDLFY